MEQPPLKFPFWIVYQRDSDGVALPVIVPSSTTSVAVFSTAQKATDYMVACGATAWEVQLVIRSSLASIVSQLQDLGFLGWHLDPSLEDSEPSDVLKG